MESFFSSQFFVGNRQRLLRLYNGDAPIVITANGLTQRGGDTTYDFSQDASFWYLTGIDDPDIILVMHDKHQYLIVPGRSASREAFDGAINIEVLKSRSGINEVLTEFEGEDRLKELLKDNKEVATLLSPGEYIESFGFYTNPARARLESKLKQLSPKVELTDIAYELLKLRVVKQPEELKALVAAINITNLSLREVLDEETLGGYSHEFQLEAELSRSFRFRGASGHGFSPIVASGKDACTLHNIANNGPINRADLIVVDCGAEVEHYSADITRTVAVSKPSPRQQAVHEAVLEVQEYAFSLLKPGVLLRQYEEKIEKFLGNKLIELNLIEEITRANVRKFYPHATSHFLGLNVHDIGDYNLPLQPGMVITVEPGIYIKSESIGVRIEDDVLITKNGIKPLSTKLGRGLKLD
jgi:Xaa-Pro aminopeptidase